MSSRQSPQPGDGTHERFLEVVLALRARMPPDDLARIDLEERERAQARANELQAVVADPRRRDAHLARFDRLLLEELGGGTTFWALTEAAWRLPRGGHAIAAPPANQLCPVLWRWLHDAWRRGLVRPDDRPPETTTRWRLTRRGALATARRRRDVRAWMHALVFGRWRPSGPMTRWAAAVRELGAVLVRQDVDLEEALQAEAARLPQPVDGFEAPAHWSPRPVSRKH